MPVRKTTMGQIRLFSDCLSGLDPDSCLIVRATDQVSAKASDCMPRSSADGDAEVVARFREGDTAAFGELVARHQLRLMRLILRLLESPDDAEDVSQEVFVSVFENRSSFRGEASFGTWATAIAVNKCRTHGRRAARRRWLTQLVKRELSPRPINRHESAEDEIEEVRLAVRRLPPTYREPVVLYYFEQMSVAEISTVLNLRPNTVDARLSRARRMLCSILSQRAEKNER